MRYLLPVLLLGCATPGLAPAQPSTLLYQEQRCRMEPAEIGWVDAGAVVILQGLVGAGKVPSYVEGVERLRKLPWSICIVDQPIQCGGTKAWGCAGPETMIVARHPTQWPALFFHELFEVVLNTLFLRPPGGHEGDVFQLEGPLRKRWLAAIEEEAACP